MLKNKIRLSERGYIYDRNGKLLVANQASYDIMVILELKILTPRILSIA
jgi:cell division protein FtsI/penicillin-binding protein 2